MKPFSSRTTRISISLRKGGSQDGCTTGAWLAIAIWLLAAPAGVCADPTEPVPRQSPPPKAAALPERKTEDDSTADEEIIIPGENLEIFVEKDPSFNGVYQVRRHGYVIVPQVGRVAVAGKTISAAEAAVKRALRSAHLHTGSVMIERKEGADLENGPLIYLSGEFREPRPWHIPSGITPTLVNVILSSGGITDKADLTRVRVMRIAANKSVVEEVNVARIIKGGGLTPDLTLGEDDVIVIPAGPPFSGGLRGVLARISGRAPHWEIKRGTSVGPGGPRKPGAADPVLEDEYQRQLLNPASLP